MDLKIYLLVPAVQSQTFCFNFSMLGCDVIIFIYKKVVKEFQSLLLEIIPSIIQ
jgi:hypothetical protein